MSKTVWMINKEIDPLVDVNVEIFGPSDISDDEKQSLKEGKRFRLLDGDNIPMFEGYLVLGSEENWFAPLDDYGTAQACTTIQIWENSEWVTI